MGFKESENLSIFLKRRLFKLCLCYALLLVGCASAVVLTVVFHDKIWVFLTSVAVLSALLALCRSVKTATRIDPFSRYAHGRLLKVEAEDKRVDTLKVGGVGFGHRKYDSFKKQVINGLFFIEEENGKIKVVRANGLSEKQLAYFKPGEPVVKYRGAKFPLTLENAERDEVLCPVCCNFSDNGKERCADCGAPRK